MEVYPPTPQQVPGVRRTGSSEKELAKIAAEEKAAEDPDAVDDLLSQEMMRLSVQDRNHIQEEIHGVRCLAVEETPELIRQSLVRLQKEIDERIPDSAKRAYLRSQEPPPNIPEHQRILEELLQLEPLPLEPLPQKPYVNDDGFRLRFLRCELFDIRKSARRMLVFLDLALELFGDVALRRPIRLSDFSKEEIRYIRKGRFQIMPTRDRSGRRVSTIFPEQEKMVCPPLVKAKICLYQSWAVGHNDVETQRKGHVILVWFDTTFAKKIAPEKLRYRFDNTKSTRVSAIHLCSPDTPYYRLRRSIAVMRSGNENRKRLRVHLGESVELQYALQGYGIPSEDIPISWTGNIKIKNLVQWIRIRHAVERYEEYGLSNPMIRGDIVECPQPNDVLFRKGNSYASHRGNAILRASIIKRAFNDDDTYDSGSLKRPKQLASDIFETRLHLQNRSVGTTNTNHETSCGIRNSNNTARERGAIGRYLTWNSKKEWWNEMTDREQICSKIEYMVREIRKAYGDLDDTKKGQKKRPSSQSSPSSHPTFAFTGMSHPNRPTLNLDSGTKIFRSQHERSIELLFGDGNHKKQRPNGALDCFQRNTSCANSSDEDTNSIEKECFGTTFSSCNS